MDCKTFLNNASKHRLICQKHLTKHDVLIVVIHTDKHLKALTLF